MNHDIIFTIVLCISVLNFRTHFMTSSKIILPTCFSKDLKFQVSVNIIDDLSHLKFNGKGETTILEQIEHFLQFCTEHNILFQDVGCRFFILMFEECIRKWCHTLTDASIHSFEHFVTKLFHVFDRYDHEHLCQKILDLRKITQ